MFWVVLSILAVAINAAKLDNTYLPPPVGSKDAGGSDGALQVPLEPPYVDDYTPAAQPNQAWRPGTRSIQKPADVDNKFSLENEDEIKVPDLEKGRFIKGSYSYTGPDNVLVTVTYRAKDAPADSEETNEEEDSAEGSAEIEPEEEGRDISGEEQQIEGDEEESAEDSVVPTPSSLPAELARAFDFHKNKHAKEDGKTNKPIRKPVKKFHKKGQHGVRKPGHLGKPHPHGQKQHESGIPVPPAYPEHHGYPHLHGQKQQASEVPVPPAYPAHHYPPQNQYGPPSIHQGYSYPKH